MDYVESRILDGDVPGFSRALGPFGMLTGSYGIYNRLTDKIWVSSRIPEKDQSMVWVHELAHKYIKELDYEKKEEDVEQVCNDVAFEIRDRLGGKLIKMYKNCRDI